VSAQDAENGGEPEPDAADGDAGKGGVDDTVDGRTVGERRKALTENLNHDNLEC
jgi:hypothetical protein